MNLKKIKNCIEYYKSCLKNKHSHFQLYKWESLEIFQNNWDIEVPDFGDMYDRSLQNSQTRRLWKRENFEPKTMMLKFIVMQPEFVRYMFKDLFDESKDIVGRVDRFVFHCDELLREYKANHPRSIENNHYHNDDYQMVSLYLAFRHPDHYTLYDFGKFKKLLEILGTKDIPHSSDFARFCKIVRTLYKLLSKDDELMASYRRRLDPKMHFHGKTLLVVEDFYTLISKNQK